MDSQKTIIVVLIVLLMAAFYFSFVDTPDTPVVPDNPYREEMENKTNKDDSIRLVIDTIYKERVITKYLYEQKKDSVANLPDCEQYVFFREYITRFNNQYNLR